MRLVATEYVTLDGVMEGPGELGWSFPFFNEEVGKFKYGELMASDALLLGRVTYEGFAAAWPTMEGTGDFGERMNNLPKYVVTSTLTSLDWNNSHVVSGNVVAEVRKLKERPGRDLLLSGSAQLHDTLMKANLIDEYRLMVHPVVVGQGKRLFKDGADGSILTLVEAKSYDSGMVVLTYHPTGRKVGQ